MSGPLLRTAFKEVNALLADLFNLISKADVQSSRRAQLRRRVLTAYPDLVFMTARLGEVIG